MQTGARAKPTPAGGRAAATRQTRQEPRNGRQPRRRATRRRSRPSRPKLRRSTLIQPRSTVSWSNIFVFAWPKRNSRPHFRGSCLRGAVASLPALIPNGRRFQLWPFNNVLWPPCGRSQFGTFAGSLAGAEVSLFIALLTPRRMSSAAINCLSFLASGGTKACEPPFSSSPFFK